MVSEANRASDVIRRIRTLLNKGAPTEVPVDIDETIREVLVLMQGLLEIQHVSVRAQLSAGRCPVIGDRVLLQQVMQSLIMNCIEAMIPIIDRPRQLLILIETRWVSRRSCRGAGLGRRARSERRRQTLPAVRYKKTKRDGDGAIYQPLDHRSAWRPQLGILGRSPWRGVSWREMDFELPASRKEPHANAFKRRCSSTRVRCCA